VKTALQQTNGQTILGLLQGDKFQAALRGCLPKHMNSERMVRIFITEIRRNPKLLECEPMSFMGSLMQCAQLGLEPGPMGHVHLVPFFNSRLSKTECQFIIGFKGMIDLASRSGLVIKNHIVYENDIFEYEYGLTEKLRHVPAQVNRGQMSFAYACTTFKDGGNAFEVMSLEEIHGIMKTAKGADGKSSPWQNYFGEMARKTVIRRLFKYLPISIELAQAIAYDEAADRGEQGQMITMDSFDMEDRGEIFEERKSDKLAEQLGQQINGVVE
jgi:recombination protein RecT